MRASDSIDTQVAAEPGALSAYRRLAPALLAATVAVAAGCATSLPTVRVNADPSELEALAGTWHGTYAGADSSGTVTFHLVAGEDHAHGAVLMTPSGAQHAYAAPGDRTPLGPDAVVQPLSISLVVAHGTEVTGTLSPYRDQGRGCDARATFSGRLSGNAIRGTFVSTCAGGGPTHTGRWSVTRASSVREVTAVIDGPVPRSSDAPGGSAHR
jgi:hypothetical protein